MEPRVIDDEDGAGVWRGVPVFLVHGVEDERVPLSTLAAAQKALTQAGANVEIWSIPGEDHFLFFSQRSAVLEWLVQRIKRQHED